jgi:hypothetical protein
MDYTEGVGWRHLKSLLLGVAFEVHREMNVSQCPLQHGYGVRPAGIRVHTLLCQDTGNVLEQAVYLQIPLLVRDLVIALVEDHDADFLLIVGVEYVHQIFLLGQHPLGHALEDRGRLEYVIQGLLSASGGDLSCLSSLPLDLKTIDDESLGFAGESEVTHKTCPPITVCSIEQQLLVPPLSETT